MFVIAHVSKELDKRYIQLIQEYIAFSVEKMTIHKNFKHIQIQIRFLTQGLEVINRYSRRETAKKYNCPIRYS